jgi:hypothetical protein
VDGLFVQCVDASPPGDPRGCCVCVHFMFTAPAGLLSDWFYVMYAAVGVYTVPVA